MNRETTRPSDRVIEYVDNMIMEGKLKTGSRLPTERDLARMLGISRTAVREGIHLLEISGIIECRQGSGNYIAYHFDQTLESVLAMMYALDELNDKQIQEFRYAIEWQAITLAAGKADQEDREYLEKCLYVLEYGESEEQRVESDRMLHQHLVQMSGNRMVIANFHALNRMIDRSILRVQKSIRDQGPETFSGFLAAHRDLVEAVLSEKIDEAKKALDRDFQYFAEYYDT